MASKRIKGFTVEIGGDTTGLSKALAQVDKNIKSTQTDLKDVERLLKLDPTNTELLAQKQKLLTEAVSDTEKRLETLKTASEQAAQTKDNYTAWKNQYEPIQQEIDKTVENLKKLKTQDEKAKQQLSSGEITQEQYDKLQDKIKSTEGNLQSLKDRAKAVSDEFGNPVSPQQYDSLQREIIETEQNLKQLQNAGNKTETAFDKLKQKISEQDKELNQLNQEYKNAVLEKGKDSDEAKSLASQIQALSQKQKENKSQLESVEKAAHDVTAEEKTLTERLKDQKSELDKLKSEYVNAVTQYGKNSKEAKSLAKQINSLSGEIDSEESALREAESSADKFDKTVKEVGETSEKASEGISAAAVAAGTFIGNFAADVLEKAASGIKQVAESSVEAGKTFETSMSKVKAISGATDEELQQLSETAQKYGRETSFSASECADALGYMALAGWKTEQMTNALPGVLNLAAASEMDLAQASDIVTDYMTAFGWEADRAGEFADKMAFAMANSNTNTEMLGEAYKNCASTAKSMHYSMEDVTAVLMTMANAGVKGGEAGTALNAVMTRLATDTKGCASALAEYGVNVYDEKGNMQDLSSILNGVSDVWENLTDEQQANLAKMIAGQNQYASFQTIMSGLSETAKESEQSFSDYADALRNCDGAASDMAETMMDNLEGDLKKMESAYEGFQLSVFENLDRPLRKIVQSLTNKLLPALTGVIEGKDGAEGVLRSAIVNLMTTISVQLRNILPKIMTIMRTILSAMMQTLLQFTNLGVTLIIGFIQGFVSSLPLIVSAALELVTSLTTSIMKLLPELIPVITEQVSILSNGLKENIPLILDAATELIQVLVTGIAQNLPLIAESALSLITALADGLLKALPELFAVLPDLIGQLADGLLSSIDMIIDTGLTLFLALVDALPDIITGILAVLPAIITSLVGGLLKHVPAIIDAGITLLTALVDALPEIIEGIIEVIPDIITALVDAVLSNLPSIIEAGFKLLVALIDKSDEIINTIVKLAPKIVSAVVAALLNNSGKMWQAGKKLFSAVGEGLVSIVESAKEWGADIIRNLVDGIFSGIGDIAEAAEKVGEKIWEYLHFSEPEKGPLADFSNWMPDFMKGLSDGLLKNRKVLEKAVQSVSETMRISLDTDFDYPFKNNPSGFSGSGTVNNYYSTDNSQTFNQTNNSPKALSRFDQYRQSKNLLRMAKKV